MFIGYLHFSPMHCFSISLPIVLLDFCSLFHPFGGILCIININSLFVMNTFPSPLFVSVLCLYLLLNNLKFQAVKYIFSLMAFKLFDFIKVFPLFNIFCNGPNSKYVRLCGLCGLCCNYSFLPSLFRSNHTQYLKKSYNRRWWLAACNWLPSVLRRKSDDEILC